MQPVSKFATYTTLSGKRLLYEEYYEKLLKIAFRYVDTYEQAQEATHHGFLLIFQELASFKNIQPTNLNTGVPEWITRTFIISLVDQMQSKPAWQVSGAVPGYLWKKNDRIPADSDIMTIELIKILKGLAAQCRIVFNLYVIDGFSHDEIARLLGITVRQSAFLLIKARRYCAGALGLLFQSAPAP